jgi:uncharacterized RDD family membrane protein YckC
MTVAWRERLPQGESAFRVCQPAGVRITRCNKSRGVCRDSKFERMTCQYCQTWNTDDEHRCRRCGRLIQDMAGRAAVRNYPIAAVATAQALEPEEDIAPEFHAAARPAVAQPALFESWPEPRVIPFDSLTSPRERRAIQERAAGLAQSPKAGAGVTKSAQSGGRREKTESRPASPRPRPRQASQNQQTFHFADESEAAALPAPVIACDDLAASPAVRLRAASVDALCTAAGVALALAPIFIYARPLVFDQWTLAWIAAVAGAVVIAYSLIWITCGCDSIGARAMRLTLVSLDGTRPNRAARYRRLLATLISVSAAGVGVLWALFDEDHLTWHDHMSGTFPTVLND